MKKKNLTSHFEDPEVEPSSLINSSKAPLYFVISEISAAPNSIPQTTPPTRRVDGLSVEIGN
jgi:hypothetical protein